MPISGCHNLPLATFNLPSRNNLQNKPNNAPTQNSLSRRPRNGASPPVQKGKPSPKFGLGFHEAVHTPLLDGGIILQKPRISTIFGKNNSANFIGTMSGDE